MSILCLLAAIPAVVYLKDQPDVEAELRNTIGEVYDALGPYEKAEAMHRAALAMRRKAFGNRHPDTIHSLSLLAGVLQGQRNKLAEAETLFREGLALRSELLGREHPDTVHSLKLLAGVLRSQGKLAEAETLYREVLAMKRELLNNEHPSLAGSLHNLADVLAQHGKLAEAEILCREAMAMRRKMLGNEHPDVAESRSFLGAILRGQGKFVEMEALFRDELENVRKAHSDNPAKLAGPMDGLLEALLVQRKYTAAEQLVREVLTPSVENQPGSVGLLRLRGTLHMYRGRFAEATADFARVIELGHPEDHEVWFWLGTILALSGKLDDYRELCRKSVERFGNTTDPLTANWIATACLILASSGADREAVARMVDTSLNPGPTHWAITWFRFAKGWAEYRQGRFANAVDWMQKVLEKTGEDLRRDVQAYMVLAMAQHQLNQVDDARAALAKGTDTADTKLAKRYSGELGGGGFNWIIAQLLMREAKALIEGQPAASRD